MASHFPNISPCLPPSAFPIPHSPFGNAHRLATRPAGKERHRAVFLEAQEFPASSMIELSSRTPNVFP
jgi:hypothetical protein